VCFDLLVYLHRHKKRKGEGTLIICISCSIARHSFNFISSQKIKVFSFAVTNRCVSNLVSYRHLPPQDLVDGSFKA